MHRWLSTSDAGFPHLLLPFHIRSDGLHVSFVILSKMQWLWWINQPYGILGREVGWTNLMLHTSIFKMHHSTAIYVAIDITAALKTNLGSYNHQTHGTASTYTMVASTGQLQVTHIKPLSLHWQLCSCNIKCTRCT
jgi:hypothetical protein